MNTYYKGQLIIGPRGPAGPDGNPIGTIISYMGLSAPQDYLICDGAEYRLADYPDLAAFFREQFGSENYFGGDGTDTFAVPDLRNLFLRGYHGAAEELLSGDLGQRQAGTVFPNLFGRLNSAGKPNIYFSAPSKNGENFEAIEKDSLSGDVNYTNYIDGVKSTSDILYGTYTARPVNMSVLFCIKAEVSVPAENVYSTDEQRIGRWIDGKPLYRKNFLFSNVTIESKSSGRIITISDLNIETTANIYGVYQKFSDIRIWKIGGQYTDIYVSNGHADGGVNGIFLYNFYASKYAFTGIVTIEYTKTTDESTIQKLTSSGLISPSAESQESVTVLKPNPDFIIDTSEIGSSVSLASNFSVDFAPTSYASASASSKVSLDFGLNKK